jgi:hypothetical protein
LKLANQLFDMGYENQIVEQYNLTLMEETEKQSVLTAYQQRFKIYCEFLCIPNSVMCTAEQLTKFCEHLVRLTFAVSLFNKNIQRIAEIAAETAQLVERLLLCATFDGDSSSTYTSHVLPMTQEQHALFFARHYPDFYSRILVQVQQQLLKYSEYLEYDSVNDCGYLDILVLQTFRSNISQEAAPILLDIEEDDTREVDVAIKYFDAFLKPFCRYRKQLLNGQVGLILQASVLGVEESRLTEWLEHRNNPQVSLFSPDESRSFKHKVINCSDLYRHICSFL